MRGRLGILEALQTEECMGQYIFLFRFSSYLLRQPSHRLCEQ